MLGVEPDVDRRVFKPRAVGPSEPIEVIRMRQRLYDLMVYGGWK